MLRRRTRLLHVVVVGVRGRHGGRRKAGIAGGTTANDGEVGQGSFTLASVGRVTRDALETRQGRRRLRSWRAATATAGRRESEGTVRLEWVACCPPPPSPTRIRYVHTNWSSFSHLLGVVCVLPRLLLLAAAAVVGRCSPLASRLLCLSLCPRKANLQPRTTSRCSLSHRPTGWTECRGSSGRLKSMAASAPLPLPCLASATHSLRPFELQHACIGHKCAGGSWPLSLLLPLRLCREAG